jgi:hypothetical protein
MISVSFVDVGADLHIRPRRTADDSGDRAVAAIAAINAGGYIDPPRHNDSDDPDRTNAVNANTPVGADVSIRPRRHHNACNAVHADRVAGIAYPAAGGYPRRGRGADLPRHGDSDDSAANNASNANAMVDAVQDR